MKPILLWLLMMAAVTCSGCMPFTTNVSTIGIGTSHVNLQQQKPEAGHNTFAVYDVPKRRPSIPRFGSENRKLKTIIDQVIFRKEDIIWSDSQQKRGTITLIVKGDPHIFNVSQHGTELDIQRDYRRWYNYPAQMLMMVSVPLDIVFSVGLITVYIPAVIIKEMVR